MTRRLLAAIAICVAIWIGIDLSRSAGDPKQFDGASVGRLEGRMWRSYYDRDRLALFLLLARNLREQFHLPFWQSHVASYYAARAAFVFKQGKQRPDYEQALPILESYYRWVLPGRDPAPLAKVELEWWIIHRERTQYPPGSLQRTLVDLAAAVYGAPREVLAEHAELRTQAMILCDEKMAQGVVSEADWQRIEELLVQSWSSLHRALAAPA
ncbi:MAG: hypothetical protein U0Q16_34815 [Bryobacteraceae bacterium]